MQCRQCQADVNPESIFCHQCGERIPQAGGDGSEGGASASSASESSATGEAARRAANASRLGPQGDGEEEVETDIWKGSYSPKAMVLGWLLVGLATVLIPIVALVMGANSTVWLVLVVALLLWWGCLGLLVIYRQWSVHYELTSQRFVHERGILKRVTDRVEVIDVDDVRFEQNIVQRLVGVGTIRISSSDRTHPELLLLGIDNVKVVAEHIDKARRKERVRRGLHIEAV